MTIDTPNDRRGEFVIGIPHTSASKLVSGDLTRENMQSLRYQRHSSNDTGRVLRRQCALRLHHRNAGR